MQRADLFTFIYGFTVTQTTRRESMLVTQKSASDIGTLVNIIHNRSSLVKYIQQKA